MNGNTITVVGNLTKDPILRYIPTGKAVTNFTVACNRSWRDKESQSWVEGETSYFKVECWEPMAENVAESLRKGDPVIVVGRLERRTYEQEGQTRESWEIKVENIGPDLRKRAASLRRVLRPGQQSEPPPNSSLAAGNEGADLGTETEIEDAEPLTATARLAVAS